MASSPQSSGNESRGKADDSVPALRPAARADFWLSDHIAGLRGRKNLSDQQKRFMVLADKVNRTIEEEHEFTALASAERAAEDARRKSPEDVVNNAAPPVDREHQLSRPAELLVLAGLLDSRTGEPVWDRAELLGALLQLAATPADSEARVTWKRIGSAMLNAASRHQRSPR
ncbi:conjugal transfer protein TraD [Paraburkholderia kururiensis]|uniref:conjugal transfer protein TraD n=1 Tax=Paraburkholderia kururiensis TaxID=984307 RepID=UPI000AD6BF69|nr:conjugal transfer protein TraD [Paraburkholderia kururiensis]